MGEEWEGGSRLAERSTAPHAAQACVQFMAQSFILPLLLLLLLQPHTAPHTAPLAPDESSAHCCEPVVASPSHCTCTHRHCHPFISLHRCLVMSGSSVAMAAPAARSFLPAPDLQSRMSFIDLCCIVTEESMDKLINLTESYEAQPQLHLTHHAIPHSQVAHLQQNIAALIAHLQRLYSIVQQQKMERDEEEEDEEHEDGAHHVNRPAVHSSHHPLEHEAEEEAEEAVKGEEEEEEEEDDDGRIDDKENSSPPARSPSHPSRISPHTFKARAAITAETQVVPMTPASAEVSLSTSTPQSSTFPASSTSPDLTRSSLRTPSTRPLRPTTTPSSLSLPPTPPTPSLSTLGLSEATLAILRLASSHATQRTSTSSLDSLDEAAVRSRPELPSTLLVRRGRKATEEQGGRLSEEMAAVDSASPPLPAFTTVLARTPHLPRSTHITCATPSSPPLAPQHFTFE